MKSEEIENLRENILRVNIGKYQVILEIEDLLRKYNPNSLEEFIKLALTEENLEEILEETEKKDYNKIKKSEQKKDKPQIKYVHSFSLPFGNSWRVLGMYDPVSNTIYIASNLSWYERNFVYYHELAHSLGIKDERQADNYATAHTGYYLAA